jgi:hypothetical protein
VHYYYRLEMGVSFLLAPGGSPPGRVQAVPFATNFSLEPHKGAHPIPGAKPEVLGYGWGMSTGARRCCCG